MGRNSCCVKQKLRKGLWSPEEDEKLYNYITRFGVGCWSSVPKLAGLQRCGKSCRLRWINYLRPDLKRGMFSQQEEDLIINLHEALGNRWAQIAAQLPGRTDNEIKNFWNSSLKKKLMKQGVDPNTHKPMSEASVMMKDERERDERERDERESAAVPVQIHHHHHQEMLPTSNNTNNHQMYNLSSMMYTNGAKMEVSRDPPLFLSELQANVAEPNFLSHPQQRPYERENHHHHHHPIINPNICGFNSMPCLTSFDFAEASRTSRFAMNDQNSMMMMNSNNGGFSWDEESKLDSVFQFQFSGIQIEERINEQKIMNSSDDFDTYSMSVFDHHRI